MRLNQYKNQSKGALECVQPKFYRNKKHHSISHQCDECLNNTNRLIAQEFIELSKNQELQNKIIFVLFQDNKENAIDFVEKYGKGNILFSIDPNSRLAIDLGVFGVPETFIIDDLEVKKKFIGPTNLLSILTEINNISK